MCSKNSKPELYGDRTVGKLIKWLRILGVPCGQSDFGSPDKIPEGALLLTKNRRLLSPRTLLIPYDRVGEQLRFVFAQIPGLKERLEPLSLCLDCNVRLEEISKEEVFGLVPDHVYETCHRFRRCPQCKRIYWRGTHPQRMSKRLEEWGLTIEMGG